VDTAVGTEGTTPGRVVDTKHNNKDYQTIPTTLIHSPQVDMTISTEGTTPDSVVDTKHNDG